MVKYEREKTLAAEKGGRKDYEMIPGLTIAFSIITLILALIFPIILAVWFCRRYQVKALAVVLGGLTFIVFQMIIRMPLLQAINNAFPSLVPTTNALGPLLLYSAYMAITAALFEEGGRFIFFKLFMKDRGDWQNAAAFGIGHGCAEAVLLVGVTYVFNIALMFMINSGRLNALPQQLQQPIDAVRMQFVQLPSYMFLITGIERLMTIPIHIALSILVVLGIVRKRQRYIWLAILIHFLLNFPLGYFSTLKYGLLVTYVFIGVFTAVSLVWIIKSRGLFNKKIF